MRRHIIKVYDNYLQFIKNGEKTVIRLPLYYNGRTTYKDIKIGDVVTFVDDDESVDVIIKLLVCSAHEFPNFLDTIFRQVDINDLPDATSGQEVKEKYIKWYGENSFYGGIIYIEFQLMEKHIDWNVSHNY